MPSSHLPRVLCDIFVYDFLCGVLGIVGGSGLRRMCSHCLQASCDFLYGPSGASWGKSIQRLRGDCTEIVQSQWSCSAVSAASRRESCREAARKWCGDRGAIVPFLSVQGIVRCHLHVYGIRTYNFSNLYNFPLNKIVEAAEPVNPFKNITAASCLRTERGIRAP